MPLIGHVVAHKSGHALNAHMVKTLLNSPQNWIIVGSAEEMQMKQPEMQFQHAAL